MDGSIDGWREREREADRQTDKINRRMQVYKGKDGNV